MIIPFGFANVGKMEADLLLGIAQCRNLVGRRRCWFVQVIRFSVYPSEPDNR